VSLSLLGHHNEYYFNFSHKCKFLVLFEKKLFRDFGTFYCVSVQTGVPRRDTFIHYLYIALSGPLIKIYFLKIYGVLGTELLSSLLTINDLRVLRLIFAVSMNELFYNHSGIAYF